MFRLAEEVDYSDRVANRNKFIKAKLRSGEFFSNYMNLIYMIFINLDISNLTLSTPGDL